MNCRWMSLSVFFLLSSPPRSSLVSAVFDFNDLLNDVTPMSPMPLPVEMGEKAKLNWWILVFLSLSSHLRKSSVSFVFDINNSLNDVTPLSPILLTVYKTRGQGVKLLMTIFLVFSFIFTIQIKCSERCV